MKNNGSSNDEEKTAIGVDEADRDKADNSSSNDGDIVDNSRVRNLKNYVREHLLPLSVILVSLFIVFIFIIIFYGLYGNQKEQALLEPEVEEVILTSPFAFRESVADNVSRQFKIILFDAGLNITNYQEKREYSSDLFEQVIELNLNEVRYDDIAKNIIYVLENNGFIMYNDDFTSAVNGRLYDDYSITVIFDVQGSANATLDTIIENPFGVQAPAIGIGKIAILIDDAGANLTLAKRIADLRRPLTIAVLPHLRYSKETADVVRESGMKVFLHYPMQPEGYPNIDPGKGAILLTTPNDKIYDITIGNVLSIGQIDGFNNHMGSAITKNSNIMSTVFDSIKAYTNVYVDSKTTPLTVAYSECRKQDGFKCGLNQKFLDNEVDHDYIAKKLYETADLAGAKGYAIAIGHLKPETIYVLEQAIPFLEGLGYEFVFVSSVIN